MSELILLVEDEPDIALALRTVLGRSGYRTIHAKDGREGLRLFYEDRPDAVVLDVGLPGLDGWAVLERLREVSDVPILMLTALSAEPDKVRGLRGGADDYLAKPFGNPELVARVQALLRRANRRPRLVDSHRDGSLEIDFAGRVVRVAGEEVALTPLEFRVLSALVRHRGAVLSAEQLLSLAWDDPSGIGPERVKFTVLRLRRKLGDGPRIEAVRGFGYRYRAADPV